jgi:hypothetical protein
MLARAVIVTRVVVPGVFVPVTLVVGMIVLVVGMSVVGIGQLLVRIAERDPFERFWGIFGAFSLTERNVMGWRIVENQVSRSRRCRKSFCGPKPHNVRSV